MAAGSPVRWSSRRVLAVAPHPDDESWVCGGLLRRAADAGAVVRVLALTRGEAGFDRIARRRGEALAKARVAELQAACGVLGAAVAVAGLGDGAVTIEAAFAPIREAIVDLGGAPLAEREDVPGVVVVGLGLDGGYGHRDHTAAVLATVAAAASVPGTTVLGAVFPAGALTPLRDALRAHGIIDPDFRDGPLGGEAFDLEVALGPGELQAKLRAIGAHASQVGVRGPDGLFPPGVVQRLAPVERYRLLAGPAPW